MLSRAHKFRILYFLAYLSIAHFFIPQFASKKDYGLFFKWDLFSHRPVKSHNELSFDQGRTFLFRDHQELLKKHRVNTVRLYKLTYDREYIKIKKQYREILTKVFNAHQLERIRIKGPLYKHILDKSRPEIIESELIYD